jgi:hypothetical protein
MSIDYISSFGIGYQVIETNEIDESELEDGLNEYIANNLGLEFEHFECGNGFTGRSEGCFIVIINPFKNGIDLSAGKQKINEEIKRLKLETRGDFDAVGGLYIC